MNAYKETLLMEKWTPKDVPQISQGKQTHRPLTRGGATLAGMGFKRGKDGGGKRPGRRKTWREVVKAVAALRGV